MAAQPQPLNWDGISVEKEWNPRTQRVDNDWTDNSLSTIFIDCSIDDPNILKNDVFLEGELSIFENDLKAAVNIGLDFEQCVDEDGSTTFVLIVTFVDNQNNRKQHKIVLYKVLRLNEKKRKLRPLADMWKDMTQAKVSLSQNGAREIITKIFGNDFLRGFENMTITEMLDQFKSDWFLSEPPNPSPGEQMEYATASSGGHSFNINAAGVSVGSRDCGPKPQEVIQSIQMLQLLRSRGQQVPSGIIQHLLSLFTAGNGNPPVFITTAGNTLDPATNPPGCSLYSLLFVNFRNMFLSRFNGLDPQEYILRLLTHLDDSEVSAPNQKFHCDLNIGVRNKGTIACFNGFRFDMRSNAMKGGIDGTNASIQYHNNVYTQRSGVGFTKNSVSKEFALSIGGNNEKNAQLIKLLTAAPNLQMNAKMLSAIILKGFGDPNQLLFNIADVLYYSLLRFQEFLKLPMDQGMISPIKTLHGFFIDTLSKCLLITCDGMLARLAVAFRFPVALQKGNTVVHFTFKETDEAQKARCAFITKKESAKNKMNAALKLLAKCGNYMSLYLITSSGTTPFLANSDWFVLSEMIKNISRGINKHISEIDVLVVDTANPLGDPNHVLMLKQIEICEKLYSESLVTKNTTSVLGSSGQSRIVYHINYKMALAIAEQPFLVRTKKCHTPQLAELEPDYLDAMRFRGNAADVDAAAVDAAAVDAPSAANATVNAPSAANATVNAPSAANDDDADDAPSAANAVANAPSAANATVNAPSVANDDDADAAPEHDNDLKNVLIGLRTSTFRNPNLCKVDRSHLARSVRGIFAGGSGGKSNKYIQRGGQKTHIIGKSVEALVGPTFLMNRDSMYIPFIQRNVLLFLYFLHKTRYQPFILQYLSREIEPSNTHLIHIIDETIREFIAVLTTLDNNEEKAVTLPTDEEEVELVEEEEKNDQLVNLVEKLTEEIDKKYKKKKSLQKELEDIRIMNDPIEKILLSASESSTNRLKRLLREEEKLKQEKLQQQLLEHKNEYQKIQHEVNNLERHIESLNLKVNAINDLLFNRGESRKKLEDNDKKYKTFKEAVNTELTKTNTEIDQAVVSLLKQPQASPAHVSAAEGEIQLSAEMKDFADTVDGIIDDLLKNPHINNGELSGFVNSLISEKEGEFLANLYWSLFIDLETQYTVSFSKSPERFNSVNKGVTLSASLAESVAREFPDESPTIESISNGVISFSIEPRRSEEGEEGEGEGDGKVLDFSPHKPTRTVYQPTRNTSVTFDVSILLELIESMICDLLSFNESEFPENPNRPPENDRSTSEILLHKLQLIELLIRDHETKEEYPGFYNELQIRLSALHAFFNTNLGLSQDEQALLLQRDPPPVATGATAGDSMGVSADSSEEDIHVPSFIEYAALCISSLDTCIQELQLVISNTEISDSLEYIYIRPSSIHINEQQPSPSPAPPVLYSPKQPNMGYAGAAVLNDTFGDAVTLDPRDRVNEGLRQMNAALANGGYSLDDSFDNSIGGGRPITKKPTRRKPRRNTRNYQSHNKRKHHSNKKSTIRHRKSYRKRNHTIKRRSHRK
jgi:hypothetical protein